MARPFYAKFMKKLEGDENSGYNYKKRFQMPSGGIDIELDCSKYQNYEDNPNLPGSDQPVDDNFADEILDGMEDDFGGG